MVVLENIYRISSTGNTPERSVTQGTREVWRSILAATLTTVTVFLPFVFSDNFLIKLMGHHIGVSIISTLLISLAVALLFIPMATYTVLRKPDRGTVFYEKVSVTQRPVQIYLVLLKTCMRNSGVTVFGAVILLFLCLILSVSLNIQDRKEVESDRFSIYVTMPTGSTAGECRPGRSCHRGTPCRVSGETRSDQPYPGNGRRADTCSQERLPPDREAQHH